jgi:azurin
MILAKYLVLPGVVVGLILSGCGQTEPKATAPASTPPAQAEVAGAAMPKPQQRVIEISANDAMKFSVTEITAVQGEVLSIKLTNVGTMPKQAMGHNLILLKADANPQAYATAALQAAKDDYEPPALADQVVAATKMLGPKESDTITFTVPDMPGTYTYLCSFPAHYIAGMKGVMIVK